MSKTLIEGRRNRVQRMRKMAEDVEERFKTKEGWISKKWFIAMFKINIGVRRKLAEDYYQDWIDLGVFEERASVVPKEKEFRVVSEPKQEQD